MLSQDIGNIKLLLDRMQKEDPAYRVFGSEQHHYRLGPTLTEAELIAFEQQHAIRLPDDYRLFLKEAGNGGIGPPSQLFMGRSGAGPYYGLQTLEDAAKWSDLCKPFPFVESSESLSEEETEALIDPDNFPGVPGALALCHMGSGIVLFLVVNGPAYGTIWEGREDFFPTDLTFGAWYRRWSDRLVERALPMLASEMAIEGRIKVGMSNQEVVAVCGGISTQCQIESSGAYVSFAHLASSFQLDENDKVARIIDHAI